MTSIKRADVIICGAGSAGIAAAYFLAQNGVKDILLVDQHPPLTQTSAKSGENYRNWWPDKMMVRFMNRSIELMAALASTTDDVFNMTRRGYLYVTSQRESDLRGYLDHYAQLDVGEIRLQKRASSRAGMPGDLDGADVLCGREIIRARFPHLAETMQTAVHVRRAGDISAQQLGMYLLGEAKKRGASVVRGKVTAVETDREGVSAVEIVSAGVPHRIETRTLINAAGPFVPGVAELLQVDLPIYSVLQQKIAIQDIHGVIPRDAPFTIMMDKQTLDWPEHEKMSLQSDAELQWLLDELPGGLHIKPEGGKESTWIKLGWAINQKPEPPLWEPDVAPEFADIVLRGATRLIPALGQTIDRIPQPVVRYAGYYTKTKENLPLIGPMGVPGAYLVGALSGFGTMASCAAGELVAAWVAGQPLPDYAAYLSLDRYDGVTDLVSSMNVYQKGEL